MLLHERKCNIDYVARGIDVDPRAKPSPSGQHQPEGNINDIRFRSCNNILVAHARHGCI